VTQTAAESPNRPLESLRQQVRSAVIWRSGTQIGGQLVAWLSTFLVIRILSPSDYGLFAMTQVILTLLNMLNGYGLASALIQRGEADERATRQLFGMLILLNVGLGALQFACAPLAAAYFKHPQVGDLLRVQAVLYIFTPFIALPYALLARAMDFRRQAWVNLASSLAGAVTAFVAALAGFGVWTLVLAPIALFATRALGMMIAARAWIWPSFDFRGAGTMARYGGTMAAGQLFWFVQSQADVFIAGRGVDAHQLGIYTTSLFLTQIFVSKFVPPLNEVAFSAYARIQHDRAQASSAFLTAVRIVMLLALPFYLGLASVADPLVHVVLGPKWLEAAPVVAILALAMPFMTLQVLFAPASDASGRPGISLRTGVIGAIILTLAFATGVRWGIMGIAVAWVVAYPIYLAISASLTLPAIGVRLRDVASEVVTPLTAAIVMALVVTVVDRLLPPLAPLPRLGVLVSIGALTYAGWLMTFARSTVAQVARLVRNRAA